MKDIRVPGVVWAGLIILAIALVHSNQAAIQAFTGLDAFYMDFIVFGLVAVLKSLKLGTDQLNQALDVIQLLLQHKKETASAGQTRGVYPAVTEPSVTLMEDDIPQRPNKVVRWLVG